MLVQVHPGERWVPRQRVHIVLESQNQRVQKVMSQRPAGSCTRCTCSNAFPEQLSYFNFQLIVCGQIGVHVVFHVDMGFKLDIGNKKLKMVEKIVLEMLYEIVAFTT